MMPRYEHNLHYHLVHQHHDGIPPLASFEELPLKNEESPPTRTGKVVQFSKAAWHRLETCLSVLPLAMTVISLVEVGVFSLTDLEQLREMMYDPEYTLQVWRFLTYMLLHNDLVHLALNVFIQLLLATPLEMEQSPLRTVLVYLGGGVCGGLGALLLDTKSYVVGASGGVYALLTSHFTHNFMNRDTLKYLRYRNGAVCVLIVTDMCCNVVHFYSSGNKEPRIGWEAHISGAAAGILLGFLCFKGTVRKTWLIPHRLLAASTLTLFVAFCILFHLFYHRTAT